MRSFLTKLKESFSFQPDGMTGELPYLTNRNSILSALSHSKLYGTIVGIKANALGDDLFLTAVEAIESTQNEYTVILKPYAISGQMLTCNKLNLDQIRCVCPFDNQYRYPVQTAE